MAKHQIWIQNKNRKLGGENCRQYKSYLKLIKDKQTYKGKIQLKKKGKIVRTYYQRRKIK